MQISLFYMRQLRLFIAAMNGLMAVNSHHEVASFDFYYHSHITSLFCVILHKSFVNYQN